ncbi:MAG: biotin--[acetyl-CoA-carboxylase] ligase [Flavobacteriales bacterium]|nr:biotin--[acetyl-CoA-carboxylase] ligase [Flavobacteriales bacterium]
MSRIHLSTTTSTNEYLKELSERMPLPEWSYVRADFQTNGKGQRGNSWMAEPNKNLLVSYFVKPTFIKPFSAFDLNRVVCNSIIRVLRHYHLYEGCIKWPNDILIRNMKVGGILIENNLSISAVENSVIGIGLNVNQDQFEGIKYGATSLSNQLGSWVDIDQLALKLEEELRNEIEELRTNPNAVRQYFFDNMFGVLNDFQFVHDGVAKTGRIVDLSLEGRIAVRVDGQIAFFNFKEIEFKLEG